MRQGRQRETDEPGKLCGVRRVLLFDEDVEDLARHAEPFEAHGFEVHKCLSVESAMRCIEREELDFALIDQVSPAFEGIRVLRHLVRYNLSTPFVVIARRKDVLCQEQAFALGAIEYLEKPVSRTEIDCLIHNFFGISQSLKQLHPNQPRPTPNGTGERERNRSRP
jgi:DNA-binding NtrC family response regulator